VYELSDIDLDLSHYSQNGLARCTCHLPFTTSLKWTDGQLSLLSFVGWKCTSFQAELGLKAV